MPWYTPLDLGDSGFASGPTTTGFQPHNFMYGSKVTIAAGGQATLIAVRCTAQTGTPTLKIGLFNSAGTLLAQGTVADAVGAAWRETTIAVAVSSGVHYIMVSSSNTNGLYYYNTGGNGLGETVAYAAAMPASISVTEDEIGTIFGVKVFVETAFVARPIRPILQAVTRSHYW